MPINEELCNEALEKLAAFVPSLVRAQNTLQKDLRKPFKPLLHRLVDPGEEGLNTDIVKEQPAGPEATTPNASKLQDFGKSLTGKSTTEVAQPWSKQDREMMAAPTPAGKRVELYGNRLKGQTSEQMAQPFTSEERRTYGMPAPAEPELSYLAGSAPIFNKAQALITEELEKDAAQFDPAQMDQLRQLIMELLSSGKFGAMGQGGGADAQPPAPEPEPEPTGYSESPYTRDEMQHFQRIGFRPKRLKSIQAIGDFRKMMNTENELLSNALSGKQDSFSGADDLPLGQYA